VDPLRQSVAGISGSLESLVDICASL
jgi:hypothetical protein